MTSAVVVDQLDDLRPGLVGYCYRMLGSPFEAEDAVQETMVRAWQGAHGFAGDASVRTWVYRIATNVCIDALRGRGRRAVPMDLGPATTVLDAAPPQPSSQPWVTPMVGPVDPAEVVVGRDTVRLAFIAALQHLPPRQRCVLILRDVLAWPAANVAALLDSSVGSVNSALQRARATLSARPPRPEGAAKLTESDRELLARYVDAFQRYDIKALVTLLHEDAIQSMPPFSLWLSGRREIGRFLLGPGAECEGSRLVPTTANGSPAFWQYRAGDVPWSLQVLELRDGRIAEIHAFVLPALFEKFGPAPMSSGEALRLDRVG